MAAVHRRGFRLDGDRDAIEIVRLSAVGNWMAMVKVADGRAVCCRNFTKFRPICCAIIWNHMVFIKIPAILIYKLFIEITVDQEQYLSIC